jgi:hypothetical protein
VYLKNMTSPLNPLSSGEGVVCIVWFIVPSPEERVRERC